MWVTKWRRAAEDKDERVAVEREMKASGHQQILQELRTRETGTKATESTAPKKMKFDLMDIDIPTDSKTQLWPMPRSTMVDKQQPSKCIKIQNVFDADK